MYSQFILSGFSAKRAMYRSLYVTMAMIMIAAVVAGCGAPAVPAEPGPAPTEAAVESAPEAVDVSELEAPMLAEMVAAGELPPLEERLPAEPLVWDFPDVNVFEKEDGKYGGTVRVGHVNDLDGFATIGLARIAADRSTYYPDIAKSWEWSDDYKSITFALREGMKWSDGEPFTANDVVFWYDEIIRSDLLESPLGVGGMNTFADRVIAVDDYTLRFEFAEPNPLFLLRSRGFGGGEVSSWERSAAHYMKQLHPKYNPDPNKDAQVQFQEMLDTLSRPRYMEDPDRPVLWAWRPQEYKEGQLARMERNPYFWAVDKNGRQLPYIDYVENFLLSDADEEVIKLKLIAGETNFERRKTSVKDVPLLRENEEKANIDLIFTVKPEGSQQGIKFSTANPDEQMAALIGNPDFRRALSLAVDRAAINETAYFGLAKPGHGFSEKGVYDPDVDGAWAEFDLEAASQMLDDIGLDQRDSEGFRTFPSGDKLTFVLEFVPGWQPGADETAEIAAEGWNQIGLRTVAQPVTHQLRSEHEQSGDFDANLVPWVGGVWDQNLRYGTGVCRWAVPQCTWWQSQNVAESDRPGMKPEGEVLQFFELEDTILSTIDEAERQAALQAHRELMADQLWVMGVVQDIPHVIVASKNLGGVWGRTDEMQYFMGSGDEDYWPRSWFFAD